MQVEVHTRTWNPGDSVGVGGHVAAEVFEDSCRRTIAREDLDGRRGHLLQRGGVL